MTELERHILNLLLDNDCVIVPGFGGFMVHRIPATYDKANSIFVPPSRVIGFNPQLTMNDSLLAQAYVSCYDISYPEALRHIESDVDALKWELEKSKSHYICGIGKIILAEDGTYDFVPDKVGVASPDLYGFDTFEIPLLTNSEDEDNEMQVQEKKEDIFPINTTSIFDNKVANTAEESKESNNKNTPDTENDEDEKEIALRIPLRVVRQIAVACVAIIILMAIPVKLGNASRSNSLQSSISNSLLLDIMPKEQTSGKPKILSDIKKGINIQKEDRKESQQNEDEGLSKQKSFYTIVLASRITQPNAEKYAKRLKDAGLDDVDVCTNGGFTKVIYRKFADRQSASKALKQLPKKNEFEGCWITEVTQ